MLISWSFWATREQRGKSFGLKLRQYELVVSLQRIHRPESFGGWCEREKRIFREQSATRPEGTEIGTYSEKGTSKSSFFYPFIEKGRNQSWSFLTIANWRGKELLSKKVRALKIWFTRKDSWIKFDVCVNSRTFWHILAKDRIDFLVSSNFYISHKFVKAERVENSLD